MSCGLLGFKGCKYGLTQMVVYLSTKSISGKDVSIHFHVRYSSLSYISHGKKNLLRRIYTRSVYPYVLTGLSNWLATLIDPPSTVERIQQFLIDYLHRNIIPPYVQRVQYSERYWATNNLSSSQNHVAVLVNLHVHQIYEQVQLFLLLLTLPKHKRPLPMYCDLT